MRQTIHLGLTLNNKNEFSESRGKFTSKHPKQHLYQKILDDAIANYDQLISEQNQPGLTSDDWKIIFSKYKKGLIKLFNEENSTEYIHAHCDEWIEDVKKGKHKNKKKGVKPRKSTIDSYKQVKRTMVDFQERYGFVNFNELNLDKILELYEFVKKPYYTKITKKNGELSKRQLGNFSPKNLLHYNVAVKMYLRFVEKRKNIKLDQEIYEITIDYKNDGETIIALEDEEYRALLNYKPINDKEQLKKEITIFLISTGLSVVDFAKITATSFEERDEKLWIVGYREKTKVKYEIPLNKRALEIAEKHDRNFKKYRFNSKSLTPYCRTIWKKIPEFERLVPKKVWNHEKDSYEKVDVPLHTAFSLHRCRNTFCKHLVEVNTPQNFILSMMAWRTVKMLTVYLQRYGIKKNNFTELVHEKFS